MSRSLALVSVLCASLSLAACDVGSVLARTGDGGGGGDGGTSAGGSDCGGLQDVTGLTGHHAANGSPGDVGATVITAHEGCMGQAGCHNGALSPTPGDIWFYGGEAFMDTAGTMPYAGATILLGLADNSQFIQLPVQQNGFFYLPSTGGFPAPGGQAVNSWLCVGTNKMGMTTQLFAGNGNCTSSSCHGPVPATGSFISLKPD